MPPRNATIFPVANVTSTGSTVLLSPADICKITARTIRASISFITPAVITVLPSLLLSNLNSIKTIALTGTAVIAKANETNSEDNNDCSNSCIT